MDAMIFAAGLGTRLRPLTDRTPKPLLPVGGVPVLERIARRLIAAGADRLVINVHHHAGQIERFIDERDGFGVDVRIAHEPERPLETGGGLMNAAPQLRRSQPFFLHNGDVLSDASLESMYAAHVAGSAIATLAVLPATSGRYLLFDDAGLCGFARRDTGEEIFARAPAGGVMRHDFAGIHVASPALLGALHGDGPFSIIPIYMQLVKAGARVAPFSIDGAHWFDIGSFEKLAAADRFYGGAGAARQ